MPSIKPPSRRPIIPDEDMQIERQFIYDNPICFGEESLFSRVDEIRVLEKTADSARIHVRFT